MKRQIVFALAVLFFAFTLALDLSAQAKPEIHHAKIPFGFHVENRQFPAGDYELRWVGPRLLIKSLEGNQQAIVIVVQVDSTTPSKRNYLKFNSYGGNEYFLSEVWVVGQNSGHELLKSKMELEMASRHEPASYAMVGLNR